MQSTSSWIWTRVAVFIFNDDNHYTVDTRDLEVNEFELQLHTFTYGLIPLGKVWASFSITKKPNQFAHSAPIASLQRGKTPANEFPWYDTKQSNGEVLVMLELWGMWSTPSLPLLPGPLWPGMVASDKGPIYGLNRTNYILMLNWIVWIRTVWLNWIAWNRNVFHN